MTLSDLRGLSNDDRNAKADRLNLSHETIRYLKTKLRTTPNPGNGICTLLWVVPNSLQLFIISYICTTISPRTIVPSTKKVNINLFLNLVRIALMRNTKNKVSPMVVIANSYGRKIK